MKWGYRPRVFVSWWQVTLILAVLLIVAYIEPIMEPIFQWMGV